MVWWQCGGKVQCQRSMETSAHMRRWVCHPRQHPTKSKRNTTICASRSTLTSTLIPVSGSNPFNLSDCPAVGLAFALVRPNPALIPCPEDGIPHKHPEALGLCPSYAHTHIAPGPPHCCCWIAPWSIPSTLGENGSDPSAVNFQRVHNVSTNAARPHCPHLPLPTACTGHVLNAHFKSAVCRPTPL